MKTINKKPYEFPQVTRVELDSEISLTLDSAFEPVGDPESMMLSSGPLLSDQSSF
jgi:hypothetical protein